MTKLPIPFLCRSGGLAWVLISVALLDSSFRLRGKEQIIIVIGFTDYR